MRGATNLQDDVWRALAMQPEPPASGLEVGKDLAVTPGEERLDAVPLIERVRPVADEFLLVDPQGRHPVRVAPVELPGVEEEILFLSPRGDGLDGDLGHDVIRKTQGSMFKVQCPKTGRRVFS